MGVPLTWPLLSHAPSLGLPGHWGGSQLSQAAAALEGASPHGSSCQRSTQGVLVPVSDPPSAASPVLSGSGSRASSG